MTFRRQILGAALAAVFAVVAPAAGGPREDLTATGADFYGLLDLLERATFGEPAARVRRALARRAETDPADADIYRAALRAAPVYEATLPEPLPDPGRPEDPGWRALAEAWRAVELRDRGEEISPGDPDALDLPGPDWEARIRGAATAVDAAAGAWPEAAVFRVWLAQDVARGPEDAAAAARGALVAARGASSAGAVRALRAGREAADRAGAARPPGFRVELITAYRAALAGDRGWSDDLRRDTRVALAYLLLHDDFAGDWAAPAEVSEGRGILREILAARPASITSRHSLAVSLGRGGDLAAAAAVLEGAPQGGPASLRIFEVMARRVRLAARPLTEALRVRSDGDAIRVEVPRGSPDGKLRWLAGDFDGWSGARRFAADDAGVESVTVRPGPGEYRYRAEGWFGPQLDPAGAPAACAGDPCFRVGEDGRLSEPAADDPAWWRMHIEARQEPIFFPKLRDWCRRMIRLDPADERALELFARTYRQAGLAARAPDALRDALRDHPAAGTAAEAFRRYLSVPDAGPEGGVDPVPGPGSSGFSSSLGTAHWSPERGEEESVDEYRTRIRNLATSGDPARVDRAWGALLESYLGPPEPGEDEARPGAEADLRAALDARGSSVSLLRWVVQHAASLRHPEVALDALRGVEGADAALLNHARTALYRRLKRHDEAVAAARLAAAAAPGDAALRHEVGCVLLDAGRPGEGADELLAAREAGDRGPHGGDRLVSALLAAHRGDEIAALSRAGMRSELNPGGPKVLLTLEQLRVDLAAGAEIDELVGRLKADLADLDEFTDPLTVFRVGGYLQLLGVSATRQRDLGMTEALEYFAGRRDLQVFTALAIVIALGFAVVAIAVLGWLLRRRHVVRAVVLAPAVSTLFLVAAFAAAAAASQYLLGNPLAGIFQPKTPAGMLCMLFAGATCSPLMAAYAFLEFRRQGVSASDLGLDRRPALSDLWGGLKTWVWYVGSVFLVLVPLVALVALNAPGGAAAVKKSALLSGETLPGVRAATRSLAPAGDGVFGAGVFALVLVVVLIAPLAEELFFRGYVYGTLRKKFGSRPAAAVSGLLFGLVHLQVILPLTYAGYCFARAYERSGSLWVPVLAHAAMNAFAVALRIAGYIS